MTNPPQAEYPSGIALPLVCFAVWLAGMALALCIVPFIKLGELAWRRKWRL